MEPKYWAHEIRAFTRYRTADGTHGVTGTTAGVSFKDGIYVGGDFSATGLPIDTDNITISGADGNGYIQFASQTVAPSLPGVHIFSDTGGHFTIGRSGSSAFNMTFDNGLLTAHRVYNAPNKSGTFAMTDDNISQFVNNAGYITTAALANYVQGPASAVSGSLPSFSGTSGKLVQDSGILTSSLVLGTRTITEGAGLAGNTYDLSANRTLAMGTPSSLGIASINGVAGTTHTHAISSSSAPGASAALLSTDTDGMLSLRRETISDYTRSPNYVNGISGWNASGAGDAEFNNLTSRGAIRGSTFTVNEITATAGTQIISKSASTLSAPCTTAASIGSSFNFVAKNSVGGVQLFAAGDMIWLKAEISTGIISSWARIDFMNNLGATTEYNAQLQSGSTSAIFPAGTPIADYGPSGSGVISLSADGTIGAIPNITLATHAGSPWSTQTIRTRMGNLNGYLDYATDVYGFGAGLRASGETWISVDSTNGLRIGNNTTTLGQWDVAGNLTLGNVATNQANVFWDNSTKQLKFRGSTNGTVVQSYIDTDGSFVSAAGNVKLNSDGLILFPATAWGGTANAVTWVLSSAVVGQASTQADTGFSQFKLYSKTSGTTAISSILLEAVNNSGFQTQVNVISWGSAESGGRASKGGVTINNGNGLIGVTFGSGNVPEHMADVYGRIMSRITANDEGYILQGATSGVSPVFKFNTSGGTTKSRIGIAGGTNGLVVGAAASDLVIRGEAQSIWFTTDGGISGAGKFDNNSAGGETRFLLWDITAGAMKRVSIGAADSGGTGFKALRIPN